MAKEKKVESEVKELKSDLEQIEPTITDLAEVSEVGLAPIDDILDYLDKQAEKDTEPCFLRIEVSHQTGTFVTAGFGSGDDFTAIILSAPTLRALWGFGGDVVEKEIEEWTGGVPLCSSRGDNMMQGKGTIIKPVDAETPDSARHMIEAVMKADFRCKDRSEDGCPWSNFGSIPGERGQACTKCVRLLLYNPDTDMAGVLTITPTSLKAWKNYKAGLPGQHYSRILTKFDLNPQKRGKYKWSVLSFTSKGEVEPEMLSGLRKLVSYQGNSVSQAEALVSEFSGLDLEREGDYPDNGNGKEDDF